jgi:hypothetical protein
MYQRELERAARQGMFKVYDVTPLQPLLLWEVPALREGAGQKGHHAPVSN